MTPEQQFAANTEGQKYNPANGGVDIYSADVMIPSFLDAYTGIGGNDIFPNMLRMLPNWKIKYSGLSKLPFFEKHRFALRSYRNQRRFV